MRWYDGLAAVMIAGLAAGLAAQEPLRALEGVAYDLLLRARQELYAAPPRARAGPSPSPVVVILLDQETALRPPFERLPQPLWTPQLAVVMDRLLDSGARLIAQQEAFTLTAGDAATAFNADYLAVLERAGREGRIVLGRRAAAPDRVGPLPEYVTAAGGDRNLRRIALSADPDGVLRHAALYESSRDVSGAVNLNPSLALELAARVVGTRPHLLDGTDLLLGRYAVPGSRENAMRLNFHGGRAAVPVYSFADIHACAEAGEDAFFRKHFDNKVVLIGRATPATARRVTAARFLNEPMAAGERCLLPEMQSLAGRQDYRTLPEAVVTATAVQNLLQQDAVKTLPRFVEPLISAALALAAAFTMLRLAAPLAAAGAVVLLAGWSYLAVVMLARETWSLPLAQPATAVFLALLTAWTYRHLRGI